MSETAQYPGLLIERWHDGEGRSGITITRDPNAPTSAWGAALADMVANPATCTTCGATWNSELATHDCEGGGK